jgi:hypothetical protein
MPDIFISYRRRDTSGYAGRLYDQLSAYFGRDHVFMDVVAIEPGADFVDTIDKKVGTCDTLIALIGKNWLTITDEQKRLRLGGQDDFVGVEVVAALKRNVQVIPVLVDGAKMPLQRELPESLQALSRLQAIEISDARFTRDVGDLIEALKGRVEARTVRSPKWIKPALVVSICVVAVAIGIWIWQNSLPPRERLKAHLATRDAASQVIPSPNFRTSENANIGGNWRAVVQKGNIKYEIYFTFEVVGDKLFGKVIYPTGEAGILNGTIAQGRISFTTKHVPDFTEEEATITVEGRVSGDEIEVVLQDKDGYAKGVAHRVARISRPKVLTPR